MRCLITSCRRAFFSLLFCITLQKQLAEAYSEQICTKTIRCLQMHFSAVHTVYTLQYFLLKIERRRTVQCKLLYIWVKTYSTVLYRSVATHIKYIHQYNGKLACNFPAKAPKCVEYHHEFLQCLSRPPRPQAEKLFPYIPFPPIIGSGLRDTLY